MSAPPDLGAHSISWCIAPARDYAALSGAEEEMFRETDVPVSAVRLSLLLAEHVTSLIGELPFRCDVRWERANYTVYRDHPVTYAPVYIGSLVCPSDSLPPLSTAHIITPLSSQHQPH